MPSWERSADVLLSTRPLVVLCVAVEGLFGPAQADEQYLILTERLPFCFTPVVDLDPREASVRLLNARGNS